MSFKSCKLCKIQRISCVPLEKNNNNKDLAAVVFSSVLFHEFFVNFNQLNLNLSGKGDTINLTSFISFIKRIQSIVRYMFVEGNPKQERNCLKTVKDSAHS